MNWKEFFVWMAAIFAVSAIAITPVWLYWDYHSQLRRQGFAFVYDPGTIGAPGTLGKWKAVPVAQAENSTK